MKETNNNFNVYKKELIKNRDNKCQHCGIELDENNFIMHHIIPVTYNGTNDSENLLLLCPNCDKEWNKPFSNILEYQIEYFIKKLLLENPNYTNIKNDIKINNEIIRPDIIFEKKNKDKKDLYFAEIKSSTSFTKNRILNSINQLISYREKVPNIKLAFIILSELPKKYIDIIKSNNIELWDINFIKKEFKNQISKESTFNFIFNKNTYLTKYVDKFQKLINELYDCPTGQENWVEYQKLIGKILELLFCPSLNSPISQSNDSLKRNRRDFILPNYSKENDTWEFLRDKYCADYIVVDAKNSGKYITKQDVLQIANYLKRDGTGLFGIIIARKGLNKSSEYAIREMWLYEHKMIIVLNDVDIEQMILEKKNGNDPTKLILKKIEDFRLTI